MVTKKIYHQHNVCIFPYMQMYFCKILLIVSLLYGLLFWWILLILVTLWDKTKLLFSGSSGTAPSNKGSPAINVLCDRLLLSSPTLYVHFFPVILMWGAVDQ